LASLGGGATRAPSECAPDRYGDVVSQMLDGRTHGRTLRWFYALSSAMHCIGQTTSEYGYRMDTLWY